MRKLLFSMILLGSISLYAQSFEELAQTPPMGWNSWNHFGCDVSAKLIKDMADALSKSGMKDAGYDYIVIDDCWQVDRDENGRIVVDSERFPNGMKEVADYVHSLGLKFGIYSCAGSRTCQGRPGSRGYQFIDAMTYSDWGVDYLKYDWCSNEGQNAEAAFKTMSDALKSVDHPIVFSICEWGDSEPWKWGEGVGHLWRTTHDIRNVYEGELNWGGLGIMDIVDKQADLWRYAGPGHWNDPDMLEVGNRGLTYDENVSHFSMWAMMAAPLMAGNDLRNMSDEIKGVLTNEEVIAVDQDPLGEQGIRFLDMGDYEIWVKFLENDEMAVCFVNRSESVWDEAWDWGRLNIYARRRAIRFTEDEYKMRDLWKHQDLKGSTMKPIDLNIPAHGVLMLRLKPVK